MLRQSQQCLVDINFLENIVQLLNQKIFDVFHIKKLIFIKELLFKTKVKIGITEDLLINILFNKIEEKDNISVNLSTFIKAISKQNKLSACNKEELQFLEDPDMVIYPNTELPDYLLSSVDSNILNKIANKYGIVCLDKELRFHKILSEIRINPIIARKNIDISNFTSSLQRGRYVIIEDPYFHTANNVFIELFLECLTNNFLEYQKFNIHIIIKDLIQFQNKIGKNLSQTETQIFVSNIEKIKTISKQLEKKHKNLKIHIHKITSPMHDRHIYSNTYWISCGHSFKEQYPVNTEWIYRPLGIYYAQFHNRLKTYEKLIFNKPDTSTINKRNY